MTMPTTPRTLREELEALQVRLDAVYQEAERLAARQPQYTPIARRVRGLWAEGSQLWHLTNAACGGRPDPPERSHR